MFDVELEKDLQTIEAVCALLNAERQFAAKSYTLLNELRPYIDEVRAFCNAQRDAFRTQQKAAEERDRSTVSAQSCAFLFFFRS